MTWLVHATVFLLLGTFSLGGAVPLDSTQNKVPVEFALRREFQEFFKTGIVGPVIKEVALEVELEDILLKNTKWDQISGETNSLVCTLCHEAIGTILKEMSQVSDPEKVIDLLVNLCVDVKISNQNFCDHLIRLMAPDLFWINDHRNLTAKDVCGMSFMSLGCTSDNPERIWEVSLPDVPKPPIEEPALPDPAAPKMKVLHLADTHFDPYYKPGSNAECGEKYFCCREESGPPLTPEAEAGKWGDYRFCDPPRWLIQATYDHVNEAHPDIDFIIWTGDLIPHDIHNTTRESNLQTIMESVQMVVDNFPGIPVFPALGNHEASPVNVFPQPYIDNEFDIHWLYNKIAELWANWLPEEVAKSVAYSAYYTTLIKPGLRVISVNSNYCYGYNWWILYDDVDPGQILDWMASELQAAEDAGEKVYLIGHIPPGHQDCALTYSHQYNRITLRYESTIAGMFYAHTHNDQYQVFYDPEETTRAYHVGYIAPSQTTYSMLNPGYRIYTVDGDYNSSSYQVLDHETWVLDLEEVNLSDDPKFYKLYSAKEAYGMSDLFPSSWSDLVPEMNDFNSTLFEDFYKYFVKDSRPLIEKGYSEAQRKRLMCGLVVSDNSDHSHCDEL